MAMMRLLQLQFRASIASHRLSPRIIPRKNGLRRANRPGPLYCRTTGDQHGTSEYA